MHVGEKRKTILEFLMVITANCIMHNYSETTTESRNMAAIFKLLNS